MTTPERQEAAAALMAALQDVDGVLDRLQFAAAWVLEAFGDKLDAETIRMLPVAGGRTRPGRPPVPLPARSQSDPREQCAVSECLGIECMHECSSSQRLSIIAARSAAPADNPHSVTGDESAVTDWDGPR